MSRGGATIEPGGIYHIISRFVAREFFIEGSQERRAYLSLFGLSIATTDWRCFAFAVMSNHLHFGFLAGSVPLAQWMRPLHTTFASWINIRRERIGAVFVRGPNVIQYQQGGVAHLINYIHHNPVRAGVVARPSDCDWTSHRSYVGLARKPSWLDTACGLQLVADAGNDQTSWLESASADREMLNAWRVRPAAPPGRPRDSIASQPALALNEVLGVIRDGGTSVGLDCTATSGASSRTSTHLLSAG